MTRTLGYLLCLPLLALLTGCGTPPEQRLEAPALHITALSGSPGGYAVSLRLINPNTVPLAVIRSAHTLYFGERRIGRVETPEPLGIPPLGSLAHTLTLPAQLSTEAGTWLAAHPGEVNVTIQSTLEIAVGTENDTIKLNSTGKGLVKAP